MEESTKQPLLYTTSRDKSNNNPEIRSNTCPPSSSSCSTTFINAQTGDIKPISNVGDFFREFSAESKKQLYLAAPVVFVAFCQFSLNAITQVFAGHVGTIELAAVSVQISVVGGLATTILFAMGSALETLCGQAFGGGQLDVLGIYLQRSWVILSATSLALMFVYVFATPILNFIGQTPEISKMAGTFSVWMIPQLFALAMNFPLLKFLQAQSKMVVVAVVVGVAVVLHTFFSWLLILKLGWGLVGAAVVLNASWWFLVVAQLLYACSGACGKAWPGFSCKAFQHLWSYVKLTLQSALMPFLQGWYLNVLVLFAGYLKDAEVSVDAMSVCLNIYGWVSMITAGFTTAISVRVSNELGAAHARTANFSVVVGAIYSSLIGIPIALILMITQKQYPDLFSDSEQVKQLLYEVTPLLAASIVVGSLQSLCGVAYGAGWQAYVAYVNLGSYYLFGIPLSLVLGYIFDMGVAGLWFGMLSGLCLQSCILFGMIYRTNWTKEASIAGDRIKEWGGKIDAKENDEESIK